MSGERVWVVAYQDYSELQVKNLRGWGSHPVQFSMKSYWGEKNKTKLKSMNNSCS